MSWYVRIYMVIDLKVLVRSFNCESRACYVGNPRESFFFEFAKVKFYLAKVSRKLGIIIIICKGLPTRCRPGSGRRRAPENASSSSQVSKSEALREPNTKAPGLRFSFSAPPCWWPGSVNRDNFAKVPRKLCERAGESQSACWRGWASKLCKKNCPEKGFRDASCMFKRLPRSDPWFSGVIWQVIYYIYIMYINK